MAAHPMDTTFAFFKFQEMFIVLGFLKGETAKPIPQASA
jgi:hypothetical protein